MLTTSNVQKAKTLKLLKLVINLGATHPYHHYAHWDWHDGSRTQTILEYERHASNNLLIFYNLIKSEHLKVLEELHPDTSLLRRTCLAITFKGLWYAHQLDDQVLL